MMEQMKVVHEASQVAYSASTAMQTNIKVSFPTDILNNENCRCCFAAHMCIYYHGSVFHIRSPTGVYLP